jgi:lysophospholipase L1-like esterase
MRRRIAATVVVALGMLAVTAAPSLAKTKTPSKTKVAHYYLALGDSLSVGIQPDSSGAIKETTQGYVNDLYAIEKKSVPKLKLVQMGCPGDTTASLLTGKGNAAAAKQFHCDRSGGSQLKAAEKFLKAHHKRGEVVLITLDIGANDVDLCTDPGEDLYPCLTAGVGTIKANTPKILTGLRKAAAPGTAMVAMNLYDPFLAAYLDPYSTLYSLAEPSVDLAEEVNGAISAADTAGKFKTADVFDAFKTTVTTPEPFDGLQVPTNVLEICALTWECAPAPVGPNIHANKTGYQVIAGAFSDVIGKLK